MPLRYADGVTGFSGLTGLDVARLTNSEDQLHAHHDERLAELLQACSQQALSAHDVLPLIFKRALDVHQTTFALGEAVAHLNLLWLAGQLIRQHDADGIYRFRTAQSSAKPMGT